MLLAEAAQEDALALVDRIGELVGQVEVREAADLKLMASGGIATWEEDDTVNAVSYTHLTLPTKA